MTKINQKENQENRKEKQREEITIEDLRNLEREGKKEEMQELGQKLQENARDYLTREIGLNFTVQPQRFFIADKEHDDPVIEARSRIHERGTKFGLFYPDRNIIQINTHSKPILLDLVEHDMLNISDIVAHELAHSDQYHKLMGLSEPLEANPDNYEIDHQGYSPWDRVMQVAPNPEMDSDIKRELSSDLNKEYHISEFELQAIDKETKSFLKNISEEYETTDQQKADKLLEQAYQTLTEKEDIYHLASPEMEAIEESFTWLVMMHHSGDLQEERKLLNLSFEMYHKPKELKQELKSLTGAYDNLTTHGEMEDDEAMKYILEKVQPRKFDYKSKKVQEKLS